ncbi:DExH-box splicing factor binding site-domain-containing protein [Phycomyces blakesleeanus]|uniref:DExH-box splicing factor binding site-domain-containing protein n=1 Tax=Phycomyces blakesleeanus TaxID=4837 RepID=A0ABR3AZ45_PHYBL
MGVGSPSKARLPLQTKKTAAPTFGNRRLGFGDDDDQDDEDEVEMLVGFEDNKAKELAPKVEKAPLAIAPLENIDWRAKKKQIYVPAQAQSFEQVSAPEVINVGEAAFGLQIMAKQTTISSSEGTALELEEQAFTETQSEEPHQSAQPNEPEEPESLEAQALKAILKASQVGEEEEKPASTLVIPVNETDAFREDIKTRPDEATMDDYENIPVEEFGAALLRGLGWKEGQGIGRNRMSAPPPAITPVKQRDALLGLGAKPEEVDKDAKKPSRKSVYEYKESSLFKKISKRKYEDEREERSESHRRRRRSRSRSLSRSPSPGHSHSHSHSHSRSCRGRSRSRSRSRSPDRNRSRASSSSSRKRSNSRDRSRYNGSSSSRSSSSRRDRSRDRSRRS